MTEMRGGLQAAYETVIAGGLIVAPTGTFTGSLGIYGRPHRRDQLSYTRSEPTSKYRIGARQVNAPPAAPPPDE